MVAIAYERNDHIMNVFISHIHEDDAGLAKLKGLLESNGLTVRDYSINADNPNNAHSEDYIKSQILAPRIRQCSTLLVYISPETRDSTYVNWEVQYAAKQDKTIVGVWARGKAECEVPEALDDYADAVVGWQGNRIIDAIEGKVERWERPDGRPCDPRPIVRYSCR